MQRLVPLLALLGAFMLCSCAETTQPVTPQPLGGVDVNNPMGFAGKRNQEAEKNYTLARLLWKDGDVCTNPDQAIEYLSKAIKIEPDYAEAYLRRGMAYSDIYQWENAFEDLTKSIRLNPVPMAYAYRGLVFMRMGNALGAQKDLTRSIEIDSKQHRAWNYRGAVKIMVHDYNGACKDFARGCSNGDCTGLNSAKEHNYCK